MVCGGHLHIATTVSQFLKRLESSGILADADLAAVRAEAAGQNGAADAEPFVKRLHKSGTITGYQIQALWKDKGHKLRLGNYVIEDELGRGGMGVVLKARHRRMQRQVAVKVLPKEMVKDAAAIARFQREVVAASQLMHPNIVAAYDADEIEGQHILAMEFVDGRDLSSVIKKHGRLSVEQAIDCVIQTARGLEFAHQKGVVHRDVKPANLLLDAKGTVKILDMGLARFSDSADVGTQAELTGTGTVMGTVDYMSPEQAMSTKTADARSDQYSLGITLWYLLTAEPAYTGDSLMARLMAHAQQPIPDLTKRRPDVPENVRAVFERMVAKKPEDRYPSMTEAITDLETCRTDASGTALVASAPVTGESNSSPGIEGGLTGFLKGLETGGGNSSPSVTHPAIATKRKRRIKSATDAATNAATDATLVSFPTSGTVKTQISEPRPSDSQLPSWLTDRRVLAGAAGALVLLIAAVVFFLRGPNGGTLRVEIADPEIEVSIKGTTIVLKGAEKKDITLEPGEHTLHVTCGDFAFDTDELTLRKGETVVVRAELLEGEVRVVRGDVVIGSKFVTSADPKGGVEVDEPGGATTDHALAIANKAIVELPQIRVNGSYTIECNLRAGPQVPPNGVAFMNSSGDRYTSLFVMENGLPAFGRYEDGVLVCTCGLKDSPHPDERPMHVAGVWDGREARLFVDGELVGRGESFRYEAKVNSHVGGAIGAFVFDAPPDPALRSLLHFTGRVDELRVSNAARYEADFTSPRRHTPDEHTLALYHCDEGSGDVLWDSSVNGHHGKIVGAEWVRVSDPTELGDVARIDLLRTHAPTAVGSAGQQPDGTWKSWTGGSLESSRPVEGDYRVELAFSQTGGYDADLGLVLPVGGTQVELIVPDEVMAQKNFSRLELVDGKPQATKPVRFGKGRVASRLVANVRREGGRWRIRASFNDDEILDRVFDEGQLSLAESRRLTRADHLGLRFGNAAFDVARFELFVPVDGSTSNSPPPAIAPFDAAAAKAH